MRRLVYAPLVQAYVKYDEGVFDVSPYIVGGSVNRKINQVSTAQLTLRNPVIGGTSNLLFTEYTGIHGTVEPHPMFHPMDPIIIMMQRLQGHPVQVFTGYLDKTPYFQMYPGLCTMEASCTLKRLLYTQWDAALPFVRYFLQQYGWALNSDSGLVNPTAESKHLKKVADGQLTGAFNDGSIGALLYAVLNVIGAWDDSTIFIEALPAAIKDLVIKLYHDIEGEVQQGEALFQSLLHQILGSGAQGSGSPSGGPTASGQVGSTGNITATSKVVPTMVAIAKTFGLPPLFVVTTWLAEGMVTNGTPNSSNAVGYFQFTSSSPYPNITVNYPADAIDLGLATTDFCKAAKAVLNANPTFINQGNWEVWAETTQQPGAGAYASYWSGKVQQAQQLINQYGNGTPVTGTGGIASRNTSGAKRSTTPSTTPSSSTAPTPSAHHPGP